MHQTLYELQCSYLVDINIARNLNKVYHAQAVTDANRRLAHLNDVELYELAGARKVFDSFASGHHDDVSVNTSVAGFWCPHCNKRRYHSKSPVRGLRDSMVNNYMCGHCGYNPDEIPCST